MTRGAVPAYPRGPATAPQEPVLLWKETFGAVWPWAAKEPVQFTLERLKSPNPGFGRRAIIFCVVLSENRAAASWWPAQAEVYIRVTTWRCTQRPAQPRQAQWKPRWAQHRLAAHRPQHYHRFWSLICSYAERWNDRWTIGELKSITSSHAAQTIRCLDAFLASVANLAVLWSASLRLIAWKLGDWWC